MNTTRMLRFSRSYPQRWKYILLWLFVAGCAAAIIYLVTLGHDIRPFQDDFYYYPPHTQKEMADLLHERYTWTGRFTSTTAQLAAGWLSIHWIVPLVSFGVMIVGIYAFMRVILTRFFELAKSANKKTSLLLALGLTLGIFLVTPSPYSSIYWLSAAPIHFWSYGLTILYSAYLIKRTTNALSLRWFDYIAMFIAPLIIGMMGEIAMFTLAAVMGVIAVFAIMKRSKKLALTIIPNGLGLGVAFYALFFSLGAIIRRGAEGSAPFSEVVPHAPYVIAKNFHALAFHLMNNKAVLIAIVLAAVMLGMLYMRSVVNKRMVLWFLAGITVVGLGVMSLNFIGVYSSVRLNVAWSRTQAFSVIVIIGLLMLYGVVGGAWMRDYFIKKHKHYLIRYTSKGILTVIGLIIVLNLGFVPYLARFGVMIRDRAVAYDARDAYIQQIKNKPTLECPIKLPTTYLVGTQENMDLFEDPAHAVNVGVVRYYKLPCQVVGQ